MKQKQGVSGLSLATSNLIMAIIALILATILIMSVFKLSSEYHKVVNSTDDYIELKPAIDDVGKASDYLTEQVRLFVVIEDDIYITNYFYESNVSKRRDNALEKIGGLLSNTLAYTNLEDACNKSYALMEMEYHAMALVLSANNKDIANYSGLNYDLSEQELSLSVDEKKAKALDLVFGEIYRNKKTEILTSVNDATMELDHMLTDNIDIATEALKNIMVFQQCIVGLLIIFLLLLFLFVAFKVVLPLRHGVNDILANDDIKVEGIKEYKYFASAYNMMRVKNQHNKEELVYEAEHDKLTGLYNRNAYDVLYSNIDLEKSAYMLIDVDNFKKINDVYGHTVGDKVLKKVSNVLRKHFRSDDYLCRIGGDEFAILIVNCGKDFIEQLKEKSRSININLQVKDEEIPPVSLSIGIAFGDKDDNTDSLFKKADIALYYTKKIGRNGCSVFNNTMTFSRDEE